MHLVIYYSIKLSTVDRLRKAIDLNNNSQIYLLTLELECCILIKDVINKFISNEIMNYMLKILLVFVRTYPLSFCHYKTFLKLRRF